MWIKSHFEFVKTQYSGLGLALISAFLPVLGFSYGFQVSGIIVGVALLFWPIVADASKKLYRSSSLHKIFYTCCALVVIGVWTMAWWTAVPPPPPPPSGPPQLLSRMDRFIFSCDVPPPDAEAAANHPQQMLRFKDDIQIWGDAIGITFSVTEIHGGLRIVAEATTPEAKRRMLGYPATKAAIEVRRIGQQEIITVFLDLPEIYRFLSYMQPVTSQDTSEVQRSIERLVRARSGGCTLL